MSRYLPCLIFAALFGMAMRARAQDAPRYELRFDAPAQSLSVRLCLAQAHAQVVFAADSTMAMRYLRDVKRDAGVALATTDESWNAQLWRPGECLTYRADLAAIAAAHQQDVGWRLGDDLVSAPQLWLLRPDVQGTADAEAQVSLPQGWNISAPWIEKLVPSSTTAKITKQPSSAALDKSVLFIIPNTPADWSATVAFGHFDEERIVLPGGVLRLSILHGADGEQRTKLRDWLAHVARAVLSAYGRLPLPDVQVLMIPVSDRVGARGRAVQFGQSIRGEGNALELLVDPARPVAEFVADWTAVHELSHLMHPYLGDRGSWLAEGLATYYQNILRARAGLLTPAQAWDRLYEGFKRGAAAAGKGTLDQAAANMQRTHAYQRVYWAGAAYWLTVDRDLRRASENQLDLETALSRFRDCCLPDYRGWKPEDFVAKLDALAGVRTFSQRYRQFAAMRQFPDWQKVYADLGIRDDGSHLVFDVAATDAQLREAMTAPRTAATTPIPKR
jgi:hypothetical protein